MGALVFGHNLQQSAQRGAHSRCFGLQRVHRGCHGASCFQGDELAAEAALCVQSVDEAMVTLLVREQSAATLEAHGVGGVGGVGVGSTFPASDDRARSFDGQLLEQFGQRERGQPALTAHEAPVALGYGAPAQAAVDALQLFATVADVQPIPTEGMPEGGLM